MRYAAVVGLVGIVAAAVAAPPPEAPSGFDNKSNGMVDEAIHQADLKTFDEVEALDDGLGPLYNAQSCRECHQSPVSGAASQITELRVGHRGPDGRFQEPRIPIARGTVIIAGRTLVNDRAVCPNGQFPDTEIQERVPLTETIRTTRVSLNLLGDGVVEAVADETLINLARRQPGESGGKIHGQALYVPVGLGSSICGAIRARDLLGLRTEIIGVQSAEAAVYAQSLEAGHAVELDSAETNADGLAVRITDADALAIMRKGVSRIVTVSDDEVAEAIRIYWTDTHNLAEGAGAAALAALMKERENMAGRRVGVLLSGGNIDLALFKEWVLK